jgi:hypothetical protein
MVKDFPDQDLINPIQREIMNANGLLLASPIKKIRSQPKIMESPVDKCKYDLKT